MIEGGEHRFLVRDNVAAPLETEPFCVLCGRPARVTRQVLFTHAETIAGDRISGGAELNLPYCGPHILRLAVIVAIAWLLAMGAAAWTAAVSLSGGPGWLAAAGALPLGLAALGLWWLRRGGGISGIVRFYGSDIVGIVYRDGRIPVPETPPSAAGRRLPEPPASSDRRALLPLLVILFLAVPLAVKIGRIWWKTRTPPPPAAPAIVPVGTHSVTIAPGSSRLVVIPASAAGRYLAYVQPSLGLRLALGSIAGAAATEPEVDRLRSALAETHVASAQASSGHLALLIVNSGDDERVCVVTVLRATSAPPR